ncbi:MAG: M23 family metallopeptidase [Pseudonocardiaceae bacterium]
MLSVVSRVLICAMLVAVLSGGTGTGLVTLTSSTSTAPAYSTAQPGADIADDQRRLRGGLFAWPLPGPPVVVRPFQAPAFPYGPGHRGVDLAAVAGAPVLAAGAGTVVFAGMVAGRGVVSVDHPGGLRTTYEPVSATVAAGDRVARGAQIGTVQLGHPGCSAAACLHWGVRRDAEYLDPLLLLAMTRVRLLPIDGRPAAGDTR